MTSNDNPGVARLSDLGWNNFFARQLEIEEYETARPVRITAQRRSGLSVLGEGLDIDIPPTGDVTVGDWLLIDTESTAYQRRLDRKSLLKRRNPGSDHSEQLIAANLDTLFIVTSCNADFNPARLERYLALAAEADVTPVVILTKADLTEDADAYRRQAEALMPGLLAEAINAKDATEAARLLPWCGAGQTVAFAGSSGVGKSTLLNALVGEDIALTQDIRTDDAKGRHTTTHRQMHPLPQGGWLIDLPGIRELGLTDAADGIEAVFADLAELANSCKFRDCAHETEPGCAVRAAIDAGEIDPDRLRRWRKLQAEDMRNSETIAQRHERDRAFGKMVKGAMAAKKR